MLLRSLNRHMNNVFRGPDDELGSAGVDGDVIDTGDETGGVDDGGEPEPDRPLTVREELKKAIAESSDPEPRPKVDKSKRFADRTKQAAPEPASTSETPPAPAEPEIAAPEALSKEAKEAWKDAPLAVKQAFIKREEDMARGVGELKQRYALIDQAIQPHTDALRQMNATPADAVNRMFLWFKALAGRPSEAFPALAQSMGLDWKQVTGTPQQAAPPADPNAPPTAPAAPEIPEPVKNYIGQLEAQMGQLAQYVQSLGGHIGGIQNTFQEQSEAKTRENLSIWSQGKPHFEAVRADMATLIQSGAIPLKANGEVDLDTAYERAIYFNPEVRAKVLAEQAAANSQVQQQSQEAATTAKTQQVVKARKAAGGSLPASTTPGQANGSAPQRKPGQRLSVRDSLKQAMQQLRDQ